MERPGPWPMVYRLDLPGFDRLGRQIMYQRLFFFLQLRRCEAMYRLLILFFKLLDHGRVINWFGSGLHSHCTSRRSGPEYCGHESGK